MSANALFSALTSDLQVQTALENIYGTIDNVDAWVAMIAEDHVAGSSLGPLAQNILIRQFERLRDGDRFFFTGDPDLRSELVTSIIDLDSITLGEIIELNTELRTMQHNVFFAAAAVPEPSMNLLCITGASLVSWMTRRRYTRKGHRNRQGRTLSHEASP